ncbi:MAG TPA: rhodanese-like domain-containing protein [Solirubrobacteraceae bacterium]|nr:rhodanese-like domain-containing protein [Solirubrobacteraceae bacterium]
MIFRQILHDDLGCASYLVGDDGAGVAAVIDPKFEIDDYLELARYLGVSIQHILETHNHADHVSGHGRLSAATGARIHIHRDAEVAYEHEPFEDGWELELGAVRVRALHAPGHRPEHTAFALIDTARGDRPWAILTGDSLFVADVARPDLAVEKEAGAREIFRSLRRLTETFPSETEVWPGHLGGSLCGGAGMDFKVSSTLGFESAYNRMLRETDEESFMRAAIDDLGPQPPNFEAIVAINRGPLLCEAQEAAPLSPRELEERQAAGALIVDARTDLEFDEAHIPAAVCIPAGQAGFGTRLAWLAAQGQDVVVVAKDDDAARHAASLALAVGIRTATGYLTGGMSEWRREGRPVQRIKRIPLDQLPARTESEPGLQILDVRERSERESGYIPGSLFEPWHDIDGLPDGLKPSQPVAVLCASGQRAAVAASLVQRAGAEDVLHVIEGGVPKWEKLGQPIEHPEPDRG